MQNVLHRLYSRSKNGLSCSGLVYDDLDVCNLFWTFLSCTTHDEFCALGVIPRFDFFLGKFSKIEFSPRVVQPENLQNKNTDVQFVIKQMYEVVPRQFLEKLSFPLTHNGENLLCTVEA